MGDVVLKDLVVLFADASIFRTLDLENKPAVLLGMNAMRAFDKISIDFARKQLRMVVPEHSSIDDAVMATTNYLCRASTALDTEAGWRAAIAAYNSPAFYLREVASTAITYNTRAVGVAR